MQKDQPAPIQKNNTQFKALFFKSAQLQAKQPCTNCCQIMTPVICLIFTYLIKELASEQLPKGNLFADSQFPYSFSDSTLLDQANRLVNKSTGQRSDVFARRQPLQWYLYDCIDSCPQSTLLGNYDGVVPQTTPQGSTILGSITNDLSQSRIGGVTVDYYNNKTGVDRSIPFFIPTSSNVNQDTFDRGEVVEASQFPTYKSGRDGLDTIPDGAVIFHEITPTKLRVTYKINDLRDTALHRNNGVTNLRETRNINSTSIWQNGTTDIRTPYGMIKLQHMITQAYGYVVSKLAGTPMTFQSGYIFTRATDQSKSFIDNIINTTSALLFPIALSLLFPVMLYSLVLQKQEKLVQMMKMNGMKISNYWLVYFIFNFTLCLVTNIVFFLLGVLLLQTDFFTKTNPLLLILVVVGWAFSQLGLAAFFQTFLSKSRSANIIGYIIAIWTMMIGSTLSVGVYQYPSEFPGWLQAVPPMAFNRLFYLMLIQCSDANCYQTIGEITPQMKNCIVSLYVGGILLFLLGAYLLEVLPQEFGVSRPPLFPFTDFYRFVTCKEERSFTKPEKDRELRKFMADDEEDNLSHAQREEVSKIRQPDDFPLVINNLRKLYKKQGYAGPYAAVKSFNLKVYKNETFGLLGPNGAGKTTLISMLTGMVTPNYGNAWIGGYDINNNISKAQLQMGVCPQFDLLWPQLTVEEHLRFYGRLKGIPSGLLENKINQAVAEVNLVPFRNFLSSSLSGGMKRRLSIAISLVGDPRIVFLDEPSTGLDPDNRRQIWEVLVRCQEKRALFLTTHIMQEADALCHRIGIITHGALRTVGNPIRLKKDYGEGYRLSLSLTNHEKRLVSANALNMLNNNVNLQESNQNQEDLRKSIHDLVDKEQIQETTRVGSGLRRIEDFILKKFQGASVARRIGQSLVFKVPVSNKISEMFIQMHGAENDLGITNIAITESSLEDVFIAVVVKFDKIVDDDQTGEPRLLQMHRESYESQPVPEPMRDMKSPPKKAQRNQEAREGSILQKNRDSVFSNEEMRRDSPED